MVKASDKIRAVRQKIQKRKAKKRAKKRKRKAKLERAKTKAKLKTAPARYEASETKRQLKGLADDTGVSKVSSKAGSLVASAGENFDKVGGVDLDGDDVLESDELAFGLDLNNNSRIEQGEVFTQDRPDRQPDAERSQESAPQARDPGRVKGLDRFLVDAGPPERSEQSAETSRDLDEYLI